MFFHISSQPVEGQWIRFCTRKCPMWSRKTHTNTHTLSLIAILRTGSSRFNGCAFIFLLLVVKKTHTLCFGPVSCHRVHILNQEVIISNIAISRHLVKSCLVSVLALATKGVVEGNAPVSSPPSSRSVTSPTKSALTLKKTTTKQQQTQIVMCTIGFHVFIYVFFCQLCIVYKYL